MMVPGQVAVFYRAVGAPIGVRVEWQAEVPELKDADLRALFAHEGNHLANVLLDLLPRGTFDALLIALLDHRKSLLRERARAPADLLRGVP